MEEPCHHGRTTLSETKTGRELRDLCASSQHCRSTVRSRRTTIGSNDWAKGTILLQVVSTECIPQHQRGILFLTASLQPRLPLRQHQIFLPLSLAHWYPRSTHGARRLSRYRPRRTNTFRSSIQTRRSARTNKQHVEPYYFCLDHLPSIIVKLTPSPSNLHLRAQVSGMVACLRLCPAIVPKSGRGAGPPAADNIRHASQEEASECDFYERGDHHQSASEHRISVCSSPTPERPTTFSSAFAAFYPAAR